MYKPEENEMGRQFIGISEKRLRHILGVSRKAYRIAKDRGHDEKFARKMFMAGWLHDVGYEFSTEQAQHPHESGELIGLIAGDGSGEQSAVEKAVRRHGRYTEEETEEYVILNMADMLISSEGKEVSVLERLDEIGSRYGEYSDQYLTACDICFRIGLTAENMARKAT